MGKSLKFRYKTRKNKKLVEIIKQLHLFKLGNQYQNRKVAQATVYILQQMGVELGYDDFTMKIVGLHSNKLSEDLSDMFPVATKEHINGLSIADCPCASCKKYKKVL